MRVFLILLVFFFASARAADAPQYLIGGGVASYHYSDKRHLDDAVMANGILGYQFSDKMAVEFLYGHADSFYTYTGDLVYDMGGEVFRPYALGGVGVTNQEESGGNTTLLGVNAGLGVAYLFSPHIRFFSDVRDSYTLSGGKNDWMLNVGILFSFDKPQPTMMEPEETSHEGFYQLEVGDTHAK